MAEYDYVPPEILSPQVDIEEGEPYGEIPKLEPNQPIFIDSSHTLSMKAAKKNKRHDKLMYRLFIYHFHKENQDKSVTYVCERNNSNFKGSQKCKGRLNYVSETNIRIVTEHNSHIEDLAQCEAELVCTYYE